MDKESVSGLGLEDLATFPLEDFFDHYEKGLKKASSFCAVFITIRSISCSWVNAHEPIVSWVGCLKMHFKVIGYILFGRIIL
jgi:hypothetical protein